MSNRAGVKVEVPGSAPEVDVQTSARATALAAGADAGPLVDGAPTGITPNPDELVAPPLVVLPDDSDSAPLLAEVVQPPLLNQTDAHHLPDQADVDPAKIKTMTLSKQGWVIPSAAEIQAKG